MANLATTDNGAAASSSSASTSPRYDVFINHRGPDVKDTLASHIYIGLTEHGLKVFLDRDEMEKGQNISSQIEHAISAASVHIAIFSPRYCESNWCLDELIGMIKSGATILPVFYKVDPSEVRWTVKDGPYSKALRELEQKTTTDTETGKEKPRFSSDAIQEWRMALSQVADLSGFVHRDGDDEWKLSHNVIQTVLQKIPKPLLSVAKYPTGLDLKLEEFENTVLSQQQETELLEAKVVGIVGVGGVGKTTLAKAFFNLRRSDYGSSSFVFDVRENASKLSPSYLQNKLLKDLKGTDHKIQSPDEGLERLKRDLSSCHALIVIDDVDKMDQLEAVLPIKKSLRSDSLILITSRDKHALRTSEVLESSIYDLNGMNKEHSKELFCCYAFHQPNPLPGFADLVDRFVKECDGLPLSLKVFGAQVFGQNEYFWQDTLENLHSILPTKILDRLRISYDSLEPNVGEIFLDIVCFFLGEDRDKARRIWGESVVQTLQDRCLLEVDSEYKIKVHDQITDMGREIAKNGSLPRRLWHHDLFQQSSPVITGVRGIKMHSSFYDFFRDNDKYEVTYPSSLRRPLRRRLDMENLFSNLQGMEDLQFLATEKDHLKDILMRVRPQHLKWFRWYGCSHSSLPDWIPMEQLRVLEIQGNSLKIPWPHQSQALPLLLRELNICAPLSDIPKSIGQLKNLERIAIQNLDSKTIKKPWPHQAQALPLQPVELNIFAPFLDITKPIEQLKKHEWIPIGNKYSKITTNPNSEITLERLPDEFCHLHSLKYIVFKEFSRMVSLPDFFRDLTNLQHVDLGGASRLQMLPESFGNLTRLKHLSLSSCTTLIISDRTLRNITTLEYLDLSYCRHLNKLPPQVAHQRSLQTLNLWGTKLKELPSCIGELCNLEDLKVGSNLLEVLPLGLGDLKSLKSLDLYRCKKLKCLPDSIGQLTQLTYLGIESCGIESLPQELLQMNNLEVLKVVNCPLWELPFKREPEKARDTLLSLGGEKCMFGLKNIYLSGTETVEVFFDEDVCPNLQRLSVIGCYELKQIGARALCGLELLTYLDVENCPNLQSIQGLEQLTKLQRLVVNGCREIPELPGLEHLTFLDYLDVSHCKKLQRIQGLEQLTKLQRLAVRGCYEIQELPGVEHLTTLDYLDVSDCKKLRSIQWLGQLTKLLCLDVSGSSEIQELQGLEHLTSLKKLIVNGCPKFQSIQGLGQLTKLTKLDIHGCYEIQELQGLEHLTSLKKLDVSECHKLENIQGLGQLTKLLKLNVSGCSEIQELQGLEHMTSLKTLYANECQKLKSIQGLEHLTFLIELNASGCKKLKNIQGLGQLSQIKILNVSKCHELGELPGVEYLRSLKILDALECPHLQLSNGIFKQLRKQLEDGFKYEQQRKRRGCLC